ncbi:MAG TPA: hypothetical protein VN040_04005 [Pseudosphingobacterium sp.]|nr:hypothetical protein [Pseudosphingobacterium sp.]
MLIWSSIRLAHHLWYEQVSSLRADGGWPVLFIHSLFCLILLALALFLLFGAYMLLARIFTWQIPFHRMIYLRLNLDKHENIIQFPGTLRNRYLLSVATLGSFFVLFLQESRTVNLYWNIAFPLFIMLVQWKKEKARPLTVLGILAVLLLLCTIKLATQGGQILLSGTPPLTAASIISFLTIGFWVFFHIKEAPKGESLWHWRFSVTILISFVFILYFNIVLKNINCHFDPMKISVKRSVMVAQKCPPYGDYVLSLTYIERGKQHGFLLPVSARLYHQVKEGDTITLQLHPGLFGWPWYHDGMGKRIR